MKQRNYGLYALAIAVVVVGALALGVPVGTLAILGLVLVCPLMMFFMMRGMGGMGGGHDTGDRGSDDREPRRRQDRDHPTGHR